MSGLRLHLVAPAEESEIIRFYAKNWLGFLSQPVSSFHENSFIMVFYICEMRLTHWHFTFSAVQSGFFVVPVQLFKVFSLLSGAGSRVAQFISVLCIDIVDVHLYLKPAPAFDIFFRQFLLRYSVVSSVVRCHLLIFITIV